MQTVEVRETMTHRPSGRSIKRVVRERDGIRVLQWQRRTYQVFGERVPFIRRDCPLA